MLWQVDEGILIKKIRETLRVRPSAPALPRTVTQDHTITWTDEHGIERKAHQKKGWFCAYDIFNTHLHPANWPESPSEWKPERWLKGESNAGSTSTYAYIPFGFGPRRCLGEKLALAEARLVTASLVLHFHISLIPGYKVDIQQAGTMKTSQGVGVKLKERSK